MQSGFGAGVPNFYSSAGGFSGRSINGNNTTNNSPPIMQFRAQPQQRPGIFLDPTTQIPSRPAPAHAPALFGKRTLSEFQALNQHQNPSMNSQILRSVRRRMLAHRSPVSPLDATTSCLLQQRYALPPVMNQQQQFQLRPQQIPPPNGAVLRGLQNPPQDSEKMMNRLQELEKQLLLDDIDDESDAVSVITNTNSEWSETIQNLISSPTAANTNGNAISPSPTSSTSSSSSIIASPPPTSSKQLLIDAATAISDGNTDVAAEILTKVETQMRNSSDQNHRLLECLLSALKARLYPDENPPPISELHGKEHAVSTQLLYDHSPCFKLAFMAANLAILETAINEEQSGSCGKLHVVDFDIGSGSQYVILLDALKQNAKLSVVKITAIVADNNEGDERVKSAGGLLSQHAQKLGILLEFKAASLGIGELSRESLGCEADELLAVNLAFKLYRMADESVSTENPRDALLRRVKSLAPKVVTLVEQEMNANTAALTARVKEVCAYYGALYESLEDNPDRVKIEEGLSRRVVNSVACEGRERVERCEVFGKWRARMSMAGFESKPLSQKLTDSLRTRLGNSTGLTIKEENGGVWFGWMGRNLTVASAWR